MKLRYFLTIFFVCTIICLHAQQPADEMIAAEKKFAATSKDLSTKKAFLSFVDTNCVGFNKEKQLNVFEEWTGYGEDSTKLTWAPEIAIMSASGTMGVTSGPWEFREKRITDTVKYHGHFATVWRKRNDGIWKAALDIGIDYSETIINSSEVQKTVLAEKIKLTENQSSLLEIDKNFSEAMHSSKVAAMQSLADKNAWLCIEGNAPLKNQAAILQHLDLIADDISFEPKGYLLAASNDLLTIYGTAYKAGNATASYIRVYKNENGKWKLALMMVN